MRSAMISALAAGVLLGGCASSGPEYFRPAERVTARGDEGEPAASYDIRDASAKLGEVQVWSDNAYRAETTNGDQTMVIVGFRVKNLGQAPLLLDAQTLQLEAVTREARRAGPAQLLSVHAVGTAPDDLTVPPQALRELYATFALPGNEKPSALASFRVRWAVNAGGRSFAQITPFVEDQAREQAFAAAYETPFVPVWGFTYDPFFYDPFAPVVIAHHPVAVAVRRVVVVPRFRHWR
jgi:hypothetical protein